MDVELQILKHLARDAHPTVAIVDEYCAEYKDLFKEVRNYGIRSKNRGKGRPCVVEYET
jgi:hypothetical protein